MCRKRRDARRDLPHATRRLRGVPSKRKHITHAIKDISRCVCCVQRGRSIAANSFTGDVPMKLRLILFCVLIFILLALPATAQPAHQDALTLTHLTDIPIVPARDSLAIGTIMAWSPD